MPTVDLLKIFFELFVFVNLSFNRAIETSFFSFEDSLNISFILSFLILFLLVGFFLDINFPFTFILTFKLVRFIVYLFPFFFLQLFHHHIKVLL